MLELLQNTIKSKETAVGRLLLHNCYVNVKSPQTTYTVNVDKLKTDRMSINEGNEIETLVRSWMASTDDNTLDKHTVLNDLYMR